VTVVFTMRDYAFFSIFALIFLQLIWMVFNHAVKPLKHYSEKTHRVELMNDWTIMITNYLMLLFTDIISNPVTRYNIGWVLIGIQGATVVVSLTLVVIDVIHGVRTTSRNAFKLAYLIISRRSAPTSASPAGRRARMTRRSIKVNLR
jgi:low affinity Fe/Cu permease